jgi:hypothetical protein
MTKNFFVTLIWAVLSLFSMPSAGSGQDTDHVLIFYVSHADTAYLNNNLSEQNMKFSFEAATFYKSIGRAGKITHIDSSITRYFWTGHTLDSSKTQLNPKRSLPENTFEYPNVFTASYDHKFFPNDIGGQELAIGFTPDANTADLPNGIAVLDREEFNLKSLYLYFPEPEGYKRLTRSYRFIQFSGFTFPDSIWEVGAKQGIFTTDHYRLETKISNIQLLR